MKQILYIAAAVLTAGILTNCSLKGAEPLHAGAVVRDTLNGTPCCVYLPESYLKVPSDQVPSTKYPVLYLQHGMYGNEDDWTEQGMLMEIMDSLLQAGEVKEMVVIMPDNCPARPTSDEEKANAMTGEWERQFPQFMAEAEAKYPISNKPSERAIAGLSMGGFHTMHVSHHLHGQFAYVGLFSAAILPLEPNPIYDNWEEEVKEQMNTTKLYWIGIGKEDFLYGLNVEYRHWLEANHIEYTYYESAGGHTWDNWQDYICRFLPKIFQ